MHIWDDHHEAFAHDAIDTLLDLLRQPKDPRWGAEFIADIEGQLTDSIGAEGRGDAEALRLFSEVILPACRPNDCPMMLSYVPTAPTVSAKLSDALVGAASIFAGHWEAGAGAIAAENQALGWLAQTAGYPAEAGGCFVAGGSAANLSALAVARQLHRERTTDRDRRGDRRAAVITGEAAHTSVAGAAHLLDLAVVRATSDERGRLTGSAVRAAAAQAEGDGLEVVAVVATGGATLTGAVDDLAGIADWCEPAEAWMHVDAAYGGAGLLVPELAPVFAGFERSSSFGIDPHKWLFTPYDCAALIYRDPAAARRTFPQRASYLETVDRHDANPSDLAFHLSRRARGLPLWFSLVANGSDAYVAAVRATLHTAASIAQAVEDRPQLALATEPSLSVVLIERQGWDRHQYERWSEDQAAAGVALINPVEFDGRPCLRLCVVNPQTQADDVIAVLDHLCP